MYARTDARTHTRTHGRTQASTHAPTIGLGFSAACTAREEQRARRSLRNSVLCVCSSSPQNTRQTSVTVSWPLCRHRGAWCLVRIFKSFQTPDLVVGRLGKTGYTCAHWSPKLPARAFCRRFLHSADSVASCRTPSSSSLLALVSCACRAHCRRLHWADTPGEAAAAHLALVSVASLSSGLSRSSARDDSDCPA